MVHHTYAACLVFTLSKLSSHNLKLRRRFIEPTAFRPRVVTFTEAGQCQETAPSVRHNWARFSPPVHLMAHTGTLPEIL
jgi:hypothetical protein